jgi:hypothetical protein
MAATAAASVVVQLGMCMLVASCIILLVAQQSSAKTLDVGGALGWTDFDTAISAAPNYQTWTSEHIIAVGDVLGRLMQQELPSSSLQPPPPPFFLH